MDAKIIIKDIRKLYAVTSQQVQKVKINIAQSTSLNKRIGIIVSALQNLEKTTLDLNKFVEPLQNFDSFLQECLILFKEFAGDNWFKRMLKAGVYKNTFANFKQRLTKISLDLKINLKPEQLIDDQQDVKDQASDIKYIADQQQKQEPTVKQSEAQQKISNKQLAAIQTRIGELCSGKISKPLIDPHYYIPFYDLTLGEEIRKEQLGTVYSGFWHKQAVAIKVFNGSLADDEKKQFIREAQVMSRLKGSNIVQFYGACLERDNTCIVMEHMQNGSLYNVIGKQHVLSPELKKAIALDVARGLSTMHGQKIIHADLNSTNVFLDENWHAKISGFRLSQGSASLLTLQEGIDLTPWLSPELLSIDGKPMEQSDIYSYGIILWELVTGKRPYAECSNKLDELTSRIKNGVHDKIPEDAPEIFKEIITLCLDLDPKKRPSLDQIIERIEKADVKSVNKAIENIYESGVQAEKKGDLKAACNYYQDASRKGHYKAFTNLGFFYLEGQGGLFKDPQKAYDLFLNAAQYGHARAQYNLGNMFEKGIGIKKDPEQALYWYQLAAKTGDNKAQQKMAKLFDYFLQEKVDDKESDLLQFNRITRSDQSQEDTGYANPQKLNVEKNLNQPSAIESSYQISYTSLHFGKVLGEGNFGKVCKGVWQGCNVAIKELKLNSNEMTESDIEDFKRETNVMINLHHGHIIQFYGVTIQPKYCMVMDFMSQGSLDFVLHSSYPLPWKLRHQIALDITSGLMHLHDKNILHGDLKSTNVLLDDRMHAKLSDFGLSKVRQNTTMGSKVENVIGAVPWMAPELFNLDGKRSRKSDMYSYGMLLWELTSRLFPFENKTPSDIQNLVRAGHRENIPEECEKDHVYFAKLIKWCWSELPEKRPKIEEAFELLSSSTEDAMDLPQNKIQ